MVKIQGNPEYIETSTSLDWALFMQEHADYERKSSEYALSIIGKFPEKTFAVTPLANIALQSLAMFADLYALMHTRGVLLIPESPQNLYLKQLGWLGRTGREDRFVDRILLGSIAEGRASARFKDVSGVLEDIELSLFYRNCATRKQEFADSYLELAYQSLAADTVNQRYEELKAEEEKVMASQRGVAGIF